MSKPKPEPSEELRPILEGVAPDAPPRTIRGWRDEAFMSQREFAARLGVSASVLSLWENDKRRPQLRTVREMAERIGIRPQQIILPVVSEGTR